MGSKQQSESEARLGQEKNGSHRREDDSAAARLTVRREHDLLQVGFAGNWLAQAGLPGFGPVEQGLRAGGPGPVRAMEFQTAALGRWDSGFMTFILKCFELCRQHQVEFRTRTLPAGASTLLQLSQASPEIEDSARSTAMPPFLSRLGLAAIAGWDGASNVMIFVGENVLAFLKVLRGGAQLRWGDAFLVMQQCGPRAVGIVALINFLIGLILAYIGAAELRRFDATLYTADLVAIATVREMACIMTGIIMCGRTGAAFAAQLGTMKVNQEIEALQTFGVSPTEFLVLPRMLALIVMMPVLVLFANLISIFGGFLVSTLTLHITPTLYISRTIHAITVTSFLLGIFKGAYFGIVVALTGCLRGIQCGTNAAAVGLATTSAVVTGITVIIASDGVFAILCNVLGI